MIAQPRLIRGVLSYSCERLCAVQDARVHTRRRRHAPCTADVAAAKELMASILAAADRPKDALDMLTAVRQMLLAMGGGGLAALPRVDGKLAAIAAQLVQGEPGTANSSAE